MAQPTARLYSQQLVHYLRFEVNYNDTGVGSGIRKGTLPSGAIIIGTDIHVATAFNAATTNSLTVGGNSASYNDIMAAADADEAATGLTQNIKPTGSSLGKLAADRDVYVMFQQTGTAATAGKAQVIIKYIPDNDG